MGVARYKLIASWLRDEISAGRITEGAKLPSEADLMRIFEAAQGTVRSALALLRTDAWIYTEHGRGSFVTTADQRRALHHDDYDHLWRVLRRDRGGDDEIVAQVQALIIELDTRQREVADLKERLERRDRAFEIMEHQILEQLHMGRSIFAAEAVTG